MDLLLGDISETHEGAPEALHTLADKGYRVMYLTARPEILTHRTREFLSARGFPDGIVHTSSDTTGAGVGTDASDYKKNELALLTAKGLVPTYAFGNRSSDSDAYAGVVADPQDRIFYRIDGAFVGRSIDSYAELLPAFRELTPVCE
jgi:phosphatidate phosphatase PAH1